MRTVLLPFSRLCTDSARPTVWIVSNQRDLDVFREVRECQCTSEVCQFVTFPVV